MSDMSSTSNAPNPFDPEIYRQAAMNPDIVAVKPLLTTLSVKKAPNRNDFVRVNADPAFTMPGRMYVDKVGSDAAFLVTPDLWSHGILGPELRRVQLYLAITTLGELFVWYVCMPGDDGRDNEYWLTSRHAVDAAMNGWVSVRSNQSVHQYKIFVPIAKFADPEWPAKSFMEILELAFRDRLISTPDHPAIKRLEGR